MILVFSDLHLGRSPASDSPVISDLESCIESYAGVQEVIFLGDLFDAYLEYPGSIQSVANSVTPLFRKLSAGGVQVNYHVGNHDLWHLDHFSKNFGIRLHLKPTTRDLFQKQYYLSHGDEEDLGQGVSSIVHQVIRHPLSYRLYRMVLPARWGQALPEWVSRRYASSESKSTTVRALNVAAETILRSDEIDVVLFGHSHAAARTDTGDGTYLNTGSWWLDRSFVEITPAGAELRTWKTVI